MLFKNKSVINIALVVSLLSSPALAYEMNNLVQLDLKRTSDSSVDVTLVTSDLYDDNVMVRKKSDNKYVILVPKVKTAGYRASNLAGVHDLVMDVNVKTVDDTSGGYTKVTLITKKPLDIKTRTMKSSPLSPEQQEYNTLIAQANMIKNNIGKVDYRNLNNPKTEVTVDKTPDVITSQNSSKMQTSAAKSNVELTEITPEVIEKQNKINKAKEKIKFKEKENISDIKQQDKALEEYTEKLPEVPEMLQEETASNLDKLEAQDNALNNKKSIFKGKVPTKLPKALGISILCFALLSLLSKMFKKSNVRVASQTPKEIFTNDLASTAATKEYYDNLAENKELSWREKYKLYAEKSATPVKRPNKKGNYAFITSPVKQSIDEKRESLERMVAQDNIADISENTSLKYQSEDISIPKSIKAANTNTVSLNQTTRSKSRFKGFEVEIPLHEQNLVNLEETPLNANRRTLKDANLKVSDVSSRHIKYEPSEYIMSSVDEYFSILDKEKTVPQKANILPESKRQHMTSPVSKSDKNNTVIKSKYAIDTDKGIYLINKDGKNSLVGKVNGKTFVLKNFDKNITNPIQVRRDNSNVYMVKAGDFKSLVEVNDEKMGVLIEL